MMDDETLAAQIELLWARDGYLGRKDSIYLKHFTADESERRRLADYTAGVRLGLTVTKPVNDIIRQYKKRHHGEVIDVGIFRVGYERGRFVDEGRRDGYLNNAFTHINYDPSKRDMWEPVHLLHNPFEVGTYINTMLGPAYVRGSHQAQVQLAGGNLRVTPARVDVTVVRQKTEAYRNNNSVFAQQQTLAGELNLNQEQFDQQIVIDPYLLQINNRRVLEAIPKREDLLREPPSNRLC